VFEDLFAPEMKNRVTECTADIALSPRADDPRIAAGGTAEREGPSRDRPFDCSAGSPGGRRPVGYRYFVLPAPFGMQTERVEHPKTRHPPTMHVRMPAPIRARCLDVM